MAKMVGGMSSESVNFKEELKQMKIPALEDIKTYLIKDRTKKQLKLEKLVSYLGAYKEMTMAQEKLTSALASMKELFTENLESICTNEEGDIDFSEILEFINKTIGGKERDEADKML